MDDVRDILLSAAKKDPTVPEAHYNLARYFGRSDAPTEERKALDNAIAAFAALPGLGGRRAGMYIDSLIWRGRFLVEAKEWLGAERDYATASAEYEKALELRRVAKGGRFGEAYAGLADVAYWQRDDLASALSLYERAEANGYSNQETSYKRGNILYRTGRYADSIEQFYKAGAEGAMSPALAYAFGSALYARNDLFAAEAYYRKASAAMGKLLEGTDEPMPQEEPSKIEILKLYLKSENNLGVALYRSAARSGDARRRNEAMTAFTHATRLYDQLSQAPAALEGVEGRNLALANMNTLLQAGKGDRLLVYTEIQKDMEFPRKDL
jgi:tetratricopeptide (TPR) repeat protein